MKMAIASLLTRQKVRAVLLQRSASDWGQGTGRILDVLLLSQRSVENLHPCTRARMVVNWAGPSVLGNLPNKTWAITFFDPPPSK